VAPGGVYAAEFNSNEVAFGQLEDKVNSGIGVYERAIKGIMHGDPTKNYVMQIAQAEAEVSKVIEMLKSKGYNKKFAEQDKIYDGKKYNDFTNDFTNMVYKWGWGKKKTGSIERPLLYSGAVNKLSAQMHLNISKELAQFMLNANAQMPRDIQTPRNIKEILGLDCKNGLINLENNPQVKVYYREIPELAYEEGAGYRLLEIKEPFYIYEKRYTYSEGDFFSVSDFSEFNRQNAFERKFVNKYFTDKHGNALKLETKLPPSYIEQISEISKLADETIKKAVKDSGVDKVLGVPRRRLYAILKTYFDKVRISRYLTARKELQKSPNNSVIARQFKQAENDYAKVSKRATLTGKVGKRTQKTIDAIMRNSQVNTYFKQIVKGLGGNAVAIGAFIMIEELLNATQTNARTKETQSELRELLAQRRADKAALIEEARNKPEYSVFFNEEDIKDILNRKEPALKAEDIYRAKYNLLTTIYGIEQEGSSDNELYKRNLKELEEAEQEEYKEHIKEIVKQDATRVNNNFIFPQPVF
jgi:hypothetical protein